MVSQDWVISYNGRLLQLPRQSRHYAPAKSRVTVRENQAGEIAVRYREIARRPEPPSAARDVVSSARRRRNTPPAWKRSYKELPTPTAASAC